MIAYANYVDRIRLNSTSMKFRLLKWTLLSILRLSKTGKHLQDVFSHCWVNLTAYNNNDS